MKKAKHVRHLAAATAGSRKQKVDWMTVTVFLVVALFAAAAAYQVGWFSAVNSSAQMQEAQ